MDIDLKLLQHAVVLARHRHFGRAASALRISQPTLSRNVAPLEKKLGVLQGACFCRAGHPLLKKSVLQPADLRPSSFVLPSLSHLYAGLIQDLDAGLTADPLTGDLLSSIAVSSASNAAEIVAGTNSLSIGHVGKVKEGVAAGRFAILNLRWRKALPAAEMGVASKRERTLPPSARTFINLIRKRIRVIEE